MSWSGGRGNGMAAISGARQFWWAAVFAAALAWSAVRPKDYPTWVLEVLPAVVAAAILVFTRQRFPLTTIVYVLILLHCLVLIVGGHYTYAEVPAFDWLREALDQDRNNYDKVGHFAQGFVPAIVAREVTIRLEVFRTPAWRNFFIVSMCLGISALYELIEWLVAVLTGTASDAFLGTQGYIWDTQSDMAYALGGAVCSLLLLGRWHDRQLRDAGYVS